MENSIHPAQADDIPAPMQSQLSNEDYLLVETNMPGAPLSWFH